MNAEPSRQQMLQRYRRRILGWGAAALSCVLVLGSVITLPRVESELEDRVDAAAAAAGVEGVTSSFSGQDGTLRCSLPGELPDDELLGELRGLRGVNTIDLGEGCNDARDAADAGDGTTETADTIAHVESTEPEVTTAPTEPPVTIPATTGDDSEDGAITDSLLDVVRNDSQFATLSELIDDSGIGDEFGADGPFTLFAPTNDAFQALGPDVIASLGRNPDLLIAVLRHHATAGSLTADEFVSGDLDMLDGTAVSISPGEAAIDSVITSGVVTAMITAGDIIAVNGVVHAVDAVLLPPGFELPAPTVPESTVPEPAVADDDDAAALETELNTFVASNPILFEPGSIDIAAASQPVIDQIAALVGQLTGISIDVQGFTDTDGNPDRNQTLSENRASSVRDALIAAGVDADALTSSGFGGTRTIVNAAGVEDKAASRRVEFVVTTV